MDEATRIALARQLLGQGIIGNTADIMQAHPIWQQAYNEAQMSGMPYPQFPEWSQMMQQQLQQMQPQQVVQAGMF